MKQIGKGAFQSDLILKVFTGHLKQTNDSVFNWGQPTGALTLATATVCVFGFLYEWG